MHVSQLPQQLGARCASATHPPQAGTLVSREPKRPTRKKDPTSRSLIGVQQWRHDRYVAPTGIDPVILQCWGNRLTNRGAGSDDPSNPIADSKRSL